MAGFSDAFFMQKALEQANLAYEKDEVPVGAILVKNNEVLSVAHNLSITKNDPSAHAEILCLKEAGKVLNNYRLIGTTMYVTLEPCAHKGKTSPCIDLIDPSIINFSP